MRLSTDKVMREKAKLLEAISGQNRGLLSGEIERAAIEEAIAGLEAENPTQRPTQRDDLLDGNWRLLYTTSQDLLNLGQFPLWTLGQIYQCIRTQTGRLYNVAEVSGLPFLEGILSVRAKISPLSEERVSVKFDRRILALQRAIDYRNPEDFANKVEAENIGPAIDIPVNDDQLNWLDTTYLDEDLRVGRGSGGSIFVLTKN